MARRTLSVRLSLASRVVLSGIVAGISGTLLAPPGSFAATSVRRNAARPLHATAPLTKDQKALHALNRLTFGPRPGDMSRVEGMGLDAWFEQQLHPARLDDHALLARLARFPAMQLPQTQLVEHFPTPAMLRQYTRGTLAMPDDATERAIYADAAWIYEQKRETRKAQNGAAPAGVMPSAAPAPGAGASMRSPASAAEEAPETMPSAEVDVVLQLAPGPRWQRLLAMSPEAMQAFRRSMKGPEQQRLLQGFTPEQAEAVEAMQAPERMVAAEVLSTRLLRDVYTERQLQAVMADFWLNHFSVYLRKNQNEPYLLPAYERAAILPNALGRFEDLLVATAKSPAMLVYLDNAESLGPDSRAAQRANGGPAARPDAPASLAKTPKGINENYARELMELHTLGVKGGYSQGDVIEVAKCFTGWTVDRPAQGGEFRFNANWHEPGPKTVLGHTIQEAGVAEGLQVLHILATSPATAHFVSFKLAQRFVSDAPPPRLVNRMAATFLKSDGDISAVLNTLFHSQEFWSPSVYRAKVKTPLEFVTSALRATDADVSRPVPLVQSMDRLGMPLYGMQTPNGYSWLAEDWVSSNALLTRMNFALVLSGNRLPGTRLNWPELLGGSVDPSIAPDTKTEDHLESVLLGQPAAVQTRDAALQEATAPGVQQAAEQTFRALPIRSRSQTGDMQPGELLRIKAGPAPAVATAPGTPLATAGGLLLGSPDFQRR